MSESFLYYVWQHQYFNKVDLQTTQGENISIFSPGTRNMHAGPDFRDSRLRIDAVEWVGCVEIHIDASAWLAHRHDHDAVYENVILHVVWKADRTIYRNDGTVLPTLELQHRIDENLLLGYRRLINSQEEIPCAVSLRRVPQLTRIAMLDKALFSRLEIKAQEVSSLLSRNMNDWEETCYQLQARNFGFKVNADPFQQLARNVPYKILMKHADQLLQVESLLFGMAGFLENNDNSDLYYTTLRREFIFLRQKYDLGKHQLNLAQWRFLRLRPANFPTIRLAQFAMVIFRQRNLFSKMMEERSVDGLKQLFMVRQSAYWQRHYHFGKTCREEIPALGMASLENIMINTVVPLLVAYGHAKDDQSYVDRAVSLLEETGGEVNQIVRRWAALDIRSRTAFDSQALIALYNNFCSKRRCLDCTIGVTLLKPALK